MSNPLFLCAFVTLVACGSKPPPPATQAPDEPAAVVASEPGVTPEATATPTPATTAPEVIPEPATPAPAQAEKDLLAAEISAYEAAKPVFDKFCAGCHTKAGPGAKKGTLAHFETTNYPFQGHHTDEMAASIRKTLGVGGGRATMPRNKPGSVQGEDLALILKWADAFDASHVSGAHEDKSKHHGHGAASKHHGHGAAK